MIEDLNKLFFTRFSEDDIKILLREKCFICRESKAIKIEPNIETINQFQCDNCHFIYNFSYEDAYTECRVLDSIILFGDEINLSIYYENKVAFVVKNRLRIIIPRTHLKKDTTYKYLLSIMDRARKLIILL